MSIHHSDQQADALVVSSVNLVQKKRPCGDADDTSWTVKVSDQ
jgi:hypothetical protein